MTKKVTKVHNKPSVNHSEDPLHVMVEFPVKVRKTIISSALDTALMLQTYAELKEIREKKFKVMQKFYVLHSDIRKLISHLEKSDLPKISMKEEVKKETKVEVKPQQVVEKPKSTQQVYSTEIEKLKAELEAIEKKLGEL